MKPVGMKPVGKPDAGKLHVRFDERGGETERAKAPPRLSSTLLKRQKNDMADAEAICEAVARANMRFVPIKTPEQQSCPMLHRTRHLFIRQQTAVINSIRAHLAEFGIVAPVGRKGVTNCCVLLPTRTTSGCLRSPVRVYRVCL
jgi:hypothetical protein